MQETWIMGRFPKNGLMYAVFFVLFALMVSACGGKSAGEPAGDLAVGDQAPDFSLQSSSGEMVKLSDYVGKQPVLLYFHMAVG